MAENAKRNSSGKNRLTIIILFISFTLTLNRGALFSQNMLQDHFSGALIGAQTIERTIIYDSFVPPVHYRPNNWSLSISPNYILEVPMVKAGGIHPHDYNDLTGKDYKGWGLGILGDYNLNKDWTFYSFAAVVETQGKMINKNKKQPEREGTFDGINNMYMLSLGAGYDILSAKNWSLPIYLGVEGKRYIMDLKFSPAPGTTSYPYIHGTSDGILWSGMWGIALSWQFEILGVKCRLIPYMMKAFFSSGPSVEHKVTKDNPAGPNSLYPVGYKETQEYDPNEGDHIGLSFSYIGGSSWSITASISGIMRSYVETGWMDSFNRSRSEGMHMKYITLTFTYRGGGEGALSEDKNLSFNQLTGGY